MSDETTTSQSSLVTSQGLRNAFGNALLGIFFAMFAYAHLRSFMEVARLSVLLMVAKEALDAFFFLTRRAAKSSSLSPYAWVTAIGGTFAPLLFRPTDGSQDLLLGQALLFFGLVLQCLGMMSLRRSIGLVPANRGIVTDGLYRFVRHPLYCAYTFVHAGYLINHPTEHNVLVFGLWFSLQMLRIFNEERFLSFEKPYREFMMQTRWRIIPFVI
jgi:protein-S-isoprenylcysteine O-methyltransferase Ste14